MIKVSWSAIKEFVNKRGISLQWVDCGEFYQLAAADNFFELECSLNKNNLNDDLLDFETNYKEISNQSQNSTVKIINETPVEICPTTIKNEHQMEPWGSEKGYFESVSGTNNYVCSITLSNVSADGLTFNYSSDIVPSIGNYIFQNECSVRSWITSIDTQNQTLTVERPILSEGTGIYSRGYYLDCVVRDWESMMYLWGAAIRIIEKDANGNIETEPCGDFIEMSVVDEYDLFKTDAICQAMFGVDAVDATPYLEAMKFEINGEYNDHWTKYYKEAWGMNVDNKTIKTIDGSPAQLLPGLVLRLSFFSTSLTNHKYHIYIDYYPTSK